MTTFDGWFSGLGACGGIVMYTTNATANINAKIPAISPILVARFRGDFVFFGLDFNPTTNQVDGKRLEPSVLDSRL
jgi:hypothetical protein